ncbi:uncharacterized protein LOC133873362 [Alnus glutinosa]|uniref:uncharacterized protein LOC133873362 n=1 Tax=Alnus glutinosa TaxID=3517 RepID=UPI002D78B15D|nr:uncharacterized protein LOC133873362 [Alnus glutinosa]
MKKNKAPGPDGFSTGLYHKAWPIVGDLVVEAVLDFFKSGRLLKEELVSDYHKSQGKPRCTLKVDLMKAYDSVDSNFVLHCLISFGAPLKFVGWIRECITSPRFSISINGTLVGYFQGRKGLRQGDPISPYLFAVAMEVLSLLLAEGASSSISRFSFHPKCHDLNLTHLCFADDLLIFSAANLSSISSIKDILGEFESLSGLKVNPAKSSFFCSSVKPVEKEGLLNALQMKEDRFPIRYLGLPLITKRLSAADCEGLIAKFTARIDSWCVKHLSFAGRLQLISSVLFSLQVFWSRIFILPLKIIRLLEQKLNRFLWNGNDSYARAKVAWDKVCFPKKEGGLGIKNMAIWNQAAMLKHIWSLFAQAGSLWVAWVDKNWLKGRSFWEISIPKSYGYLMDIYGFRPVYDAGSCIDAKLSSIIKRGEWHWPYARFDLLVHIQSQLSLVTIGLDDQVIWKAKNGVYNCAETDALITKEKMCIWGYEGDILCPFCRACIECRDHLFFKCSFSRRIWRNVMQSCLEPFPVVDWDDVAIWCMMQLKGKSLKTRLCKLSLGAVVYHIWIQRNNLIHGNVVYSKEGLIARIKWEISVSYDKAITFNLAYCAIGSLIPAVHSCTIYYLATSNHYWYPHSAFRLRWLSTGSLPLILPLMLANISSIASFSHPPFTALRH